MLVSISYKTSLKDVWVPSSFAMPIGSGTIAVEVLTSLFTKFAAGLCNLLKYFHFLGARHCGTYVWPIKSFKNGPRPPFLNNMSGSAGSCSSWFWKWIFHLFLHINFLTWKYCPKYTYLNWSILTNSLHEHHNHRATTFESLVTFNEKKRYCLFCHLTLHVFLPPHSSVMKTRLH